MREPGTLATKGQEAMTTLEIKQAVRKRDGNQCQDCGRMHQPSERALDVHRITPGSAYSDEEGYCVTLCRGCHRKRHGSNKRRPNGRYRIYFDCDEVLSAAIKLQTIRTGYRHRGDFVAHVMREATRKD